MEIQNLQNHILKKNSMNEMLTYIYGGIEKTRSIEHTNLPLHLLVFLSNIALVDIIVPYLQLETLYNKQQIIAQNGIRRAKFG